MLKITYSDSDLRIERLGLTVEAMVAQRSLVALRARQPMVVQPGYGSFSLPADLPGVETLAQASGGGVEVAVADSEPDRTPHRHWLEITLGGTWLTDCSTSDEGILVVDLGEPLERQIVALWQQSLAWAAGLNSAGLPKACQGR